MDIFDFALKMELDGEKYYRDLAKKVKYDDLKKVLEDLADDEQRHYEIIQSAKNQTLRHIDANPSLTKTQNIFTLDKKFIQEHQEVIVGLKYEQIDLYRAALVKEQESVALYKKLKGDLQKSEEKSICEQLVHEEEKHVEVIDNIIYFLNHVNDWVESAEFNHTDTY